MRCGAVQKAACASAAAVRRRAGRWWRVAWRTKAVARRIAA